MQTFDPFKTLGNYINTDGKLNIFGGKREGFDPLKSLNTYITKDGKLNIFGGQIEGFDPNILPDQLYNIQIAELKLGNIQEMKTFVRNLDTPIKDMTADLLTNRIQVLTAVKSWLSRFEQMLKNDIKQNSDRLSKDNINVMVISNLDSIFVFFNRMINLVVLHSEELKRQLASGGSVEFFTITPIVLSMPDQAKNDFNRFVSKYGLTFDDVVEFINNAELPAKELNSKGKILRLRVLSLFRQILSITIGGDFLIKMYLSMREEPPEKINTTVQIAQLVHNVVSYIIDLHIKELYDNMNRDEIKIGNYFEKFIRYYPIENEVVNKELSRSRITLTDLQTQIDSLKLESNKVKANADKLISDTKADADRARIEADKRIMDTRADADRRIMDTKVDADRRIMDAKNDGDRRVNDAKAGVNKQIELIKEDSNKAIKKEQVIQQGLAAGIALMFILCLIMTIMYFRK